MTLVYIVAIIAANAILFGVVYEPAFRMADPFTSDFLYPKYIGIVSAITDVLIGGLLGFLIWKMGATNPGWMIAYGVTALITTLIASVSGMEKGDECKIKARRALELQSEQLRRRTSSG